MLNDSRAPVLIVDAVFLPEIEKILDQAVFLKSVVVCGVQGHAHLSFKQEAIQAMQVVLFAACVMPAITATTAGR